MLVTSTDNKVRRLVAAGAFAAAAVAAPFAASVFGAAGDVQAGPACLAWFGNKEDGKCLSYSNGQGVNVVSPQFGFDGPGGPGISTGPLLPGRIYGNGTGF